VKRSGARVSGVGCRVSGGPTPWVLALVLTLVAGGAGAASGPGVSDTRHPTPDTRERSEPYLLGPEDAVAIRVVGYEEFSGTAIVRPDGRAQKCAYDPDRFVAEVGATLIGDVERAADTMGHIWFRDVVDQYTSAALAAKRVDKAYQAQNVMHALFAKRGVVADVVNAIGARAEELRKMATKSVKPQLRVRA